MSMILLPKNWEERNLYLALSILFDSLWPLREAYSLYRITPFKLFFCMYVLQEASGVVHFCIGFIDV